jgi:Winged helix DNA-binding domain
MTLKQIAQIRLQSQQLLSTQYKTPADIVGWMGAMQAQDYAMAKWAIGARLPKIVNDSIETAIASGEIIRTHVLRPTWHFVLAKDISWMIDLSAPRIKAALRSNNKRLELSAPVVRKSNKIIEKAFTCRKHLTREELVNELLRHKIALNDSMPAMLLIAAELEKIICSGAPKGNKQTYALFNDRIAAAKPTPRQEALAKLAGIYFNSRCPATLQDFTWWSGLSVKEATEGLESVKQHYDLQVIGNKKYWLSNSSSAAVRTNKVLLLPAFDEFLLSYADRTASLTFDDHKKVCSNNGIFYPSVVANGQVTGTWNRRVKNGKLVVDAHLFGPPDSRLVNGIKTAVKKVARFLKTEAEVIYNTN